MKTGTKVAKPYLAKSYTYRFYGEDYAHPLRAMAQWVHRHPEATVIEVAVGGRRQDWNVLVLLTVSFDA
jgi:hypothetical protein